jgi:hypothetical protein
MSSEKFDGILVYSEFDGKEGPVVRAHYPETLNQQDMKQLAGMCMPGFGQQSDISNKGSGFVAFQLSDTLVVSSFYKYLRGSVTTLTGASLVSISIVTEKLTNPFRYKPFLELILTPLFRTVVDSKILKQIYEAVTSTGIIDKEISVKGPPIRIKARIIHDNELPMHFYELEKDLGRV